MWSVVLLVVSVHVACGAVGSECASGLWFCSQCGCLWSVVLLAVSVHVVCGAVGSECACGLWCGWQ